MNLTEELCNTWRAHSGQVVLVYDTTFVRLVGIGCDDSDVYYICDSLERDTHTRIWFSAVGHLEPMLGCLNTKTYTRIDNRLRAGGSLPEPFYFESRMGDPRCYWRDGPGPDLPYCPECDTDWVRLHPTKTLPRTIPHTAFPGCACHHKCPTCGTVRQQYAPGALHPERRGFLCPHCDAAP